MMNFLNKGILYKLVKVYVKANGRFAQTYCVKNVSSVLKVLQNVILFVHKHNSFLLLTFDYFLLFIYNTYCILAFCRLFNHYILRARSLVVSDLRSKTW